MKNKKHGFTLAETAITFCLIAFVALIVLPSITKVNSTINKVKIKNDYMHLTQLFNKVLQNPRYYSQESDLTDLSQVNSFNGKQFNQGEDKFRDIMMFEMEFEGDDTIPCEVLTNDGKIETQNACFQTQNQTIWYIPRTDFN